LGKPVTKGLSNVCGFLVRSLTTKTLSRSPVIVELDGLKEGKFTVISQHAMFLGILA
jgi:hypothetical protein